jgi:predicted YcjX-like family ATPase
VRATREATVDWGGERLPAIIGTPLAGEVIDGQTFDGTTETAAFPGDLPQDPAALFAPARLPRGSQFRFVRFRPPALIGNDNGAPTLPHIRLDRALQFLIGDRLR